MEYGFYVNGEKRMPTQEEAQILLDRLMEKLGYEKKVKSERKEQKIVV